MRASSPTAHKFCLALTHGINPSAALLFGTYCSGPTFLGTPPSKADPSDTIDDVEELRWIWYGATGDEQPDHLHTRESRLQDVLGRDKARPCHQKVVEECNAVWGRFRLLLVDIVELGEFIRARAGTIVRRGPISLLRQQFADVRRLGKFHLLQHAKQPIIISRIVLRFGRGHRHKRGLCRIGHVDRCDERFGSLGDTALFILPLRSALTLDALLEIVDELIGRPGRITRARRILAEVKTAIVFGQEAVLLPREIVDLSEALRKGAV